MYALDIKLLRDLRRLWAQALAVALVIAGGVATLVMAVGSYRSLDETRAAYYERYQFADVFATVRRAPKTLVDRIGEIPGVAAVDARVAKLALLDLPNVREPATGQLVSLPEGGQPALNRLHIRQGRLPDPARPDEAVINESFAKAHRFALGDAFGANLNGRKRELVIVGIALSPEFIYARGPGDIMPDDRRFGVIWMSEKALTSAYDLDEAFSSVSLKLLRNAAEPEVIRRLDELLDRYGGSAAHGRKDQMSHAFLDHELDMLSNMSRTLPPIFLLVAAFLVNLTLSRMVTLEREQIGLLKALGYGNTAIAAHYVKFVVCVASLGIAVGATAGTLLGGYVTRLFGDYFHFPLLVFINSPDLYLVAALLSILAAAAGAIGSLRNAVALPPAVAMQPAAPARFHRLLPHGLKLGGYLSQPTLMMLRNVARQPVRAGLTTIGMAFSTAILVVSLFTTDTMEQLIDVTYFLSERQDATLSFVEKRSANVVYEVERLPGVLAAEPYREVPARIRYGNIERRVMIGARPPDADLSRVVDIALRPVAVPESGLAVSEYLAGILGVRVGALVEVDLLDGPRKTVTLPISASVEDYFGIRGMMDADALSRLMREAPAVNSVNLSFDENQVDLLFEAIKNMPTVAAFALQRASLASFRATLAVLVTAMGSIYTGLAAIIAFGVVYNSARISLSEHARELASLRVLGFSRGEVFRILLLELTAIALIAQPPGWIIGYGLAWIMKTNLAGELMRVRLVVENLTYALASTIVLGAALASALVVRERVNRLDLIAVLKTRD